MSIFLSFFFYQTAMKEIQAYYNLDEMRAKMFNDFTKQSSINTHIQSGRVHIIIDTSVLGKLKRIDLAYVINASLILSFMEIFHINFFINETILVSNIF